MRDSTIFYRSFYEAIKELSKEHQAEVYTAIFEYSLYFNEIELIGIPKTIFTLIKPQLSANIKRYTAGIENGHKGGEYGHLGGRPPSNKGINNPKITLSKPSNVNDNEKDNEKEILFNSFWEQYPTKVSKQKCKAKFLKLSTEVQNHILNILPEYIIYKPFESYTHPNPETFLNQKRYEDKIPKTKPIENQINREDIPHGERQPIYTNIK